MKKTIILLLFLAAFYSGHSQNTWSFLLDNDTRKYSSHAIECPDGSVLTMISESDGQNYGPSEPTIAYILKFNPYGDTSTIHFHFGDSLFAFNYVFNINKNEYLINGYTKIEGTETHSPFMIKLDTILNTKWVKHFNIDAEGGFYFRRAFADNERLNLAGVVCPTTSFLYYYPFFMKIDSHGNVIDSCGYYGGSFPGYDVLRTPDHLHYWFMIPGLLSSVNASCAVFDSSFNYLFRIPLNDYTKLWQLTTKWHNNGNVIMTTKNNRPGVPYQDDEIEIIVVDQNMNTINNNFYGSPDTSDHPAKYNSTMDFINPDTIYFVGHKNEEWGLPSPGAVSWIMIGQTDSLLQPRFINFIGGDAYYESGYILATHDGGCFISAEKWMPEKHIYDLLFLKLNNEGLIVGETPPGMSIKKALVYPNPAQNILHVETALRDATLQIFDTQGRPVHSEKLQGKNLTIDVSGFRPGTYVYTISNRDGEIEQGKIVRN